MTRRDYVNYLGKEPERTVKGVAFEANEVVGLAYLSRIDGYQFLMFDIRDTSFSMKRAIIKAWDIIKPWMTYNTYAVEEDRSTARALIQHFGFTHLCDEVWIWQPPSPM